MIAEASPFEEFRTALTGREVSHVWRGYGTALFIEFGDLRPSIVTRRDGSRGNPEGELGLMVEWSWRIEDQTSVICGSDSEAEMQRVALESLLGAKVVDAALLGRLPELSIELETGVCIRTFMTAEGDPEWALADRRRPASSRWLSIYGGQFREEIEPSWRSRLMSE